MIRRNYQILMFQMELQVSEGRTQVSHAIYDLCDKKPKPDMVKSNLLAMGVPDRCPITENSTFCYQGNKEMTFSLVGQKLLAFFETTPAVNFKVKIVHDTGLSCFEGTFKVVKVTI